jgi:parallel beta-helix repeat protein
VDTAGRYTAGTTSGTYRIIARQLNGTLADTATVAITTETAPSPGEGGTVTGDYYVAPTGSDANPGTSASPFRTIQRAADVAEAGDVILVRNGVYTGSSSTVVAIRRGGSASGGYVTFRAENRGGAKLDGRDNTSEWGFSLHSGANYVRIEGFEIYGTVHGIEVYNGVHHIAIVNNHVHHTGRTCTDTSGGQSAIFVGGGAEHVLLEGNLLHNIGRLAPGEDGCQLSTDNYQNHDHGIYLAETDNVTIRNNLLYNITRGFHIQRYSSSGYVADRVWILNNTFGLPNPYRSAQITVQTASTNLRIENNIFYNPKDAGINFGSMSFPNAMVRNNLTYSGVTKLGSPSEVTFSGNLDNTDPQVVDASRGDFRLQSGSPAIDRGLSLTEVKTDYAGITRPRGSTHDLGAYER